MTSSSSGDDIFVGSQEEWLAAVPRYQLETINNLLGAGNTPERVAEIWLSSNGAESVAGFGSSSTNQAFVDKVKIEVREFVCGGKKYESDRKALLSHSGKTQTFVVSTISTAVALHVGAAAAYLVPVIALLLVVCAKVGRNAWCADFQSGAEQ